MRLDKFLSITGTATRSESSKAARAGKISVDGIPCLKADFHIDPETNVVTYCGEVVTYRRNTYIMLNKPEGYVSATEDPKEKTVLDLLPEKLQRIGLFPCGRLDKYTLGLMILTDNGELAHRLLSPKHHAEKVYHFKCEKNVSDIEYLQSGVTLDDGYVTKPSKITLNSEKEGLITLIEGKYHQIKRMFEAVGNRVVYLERISFAGVTLDISLKRGEWRYLTDDEIKLLECK